MTVEGLRTVWELRGESCIELEEVVPDKKQIVNSCAFGKDVGDYKELSEAIASYATRAAEKLRAQNSICNHISVWLQTNGFKPEKPQYNNMISCRLPEPTAFTPHCHQICPLPSRKNLQGRIRIQEGWSGSYGYSPRR